MSNDILIQIRDIIAQHLDMSEYRIFLYGSRAVGDYHFRSDYDIGILGSGPVERSILSNIEEDLERVPALIDLTDFSRVSDVFREEAMKDVIWIDESLKK
ncbi:nucleotidyltransferase domain-containing protein [Candidatus Gracilibacteria bacterium]|nr:nucleotidyltransferase domain-containing protein [Candidatus Gracilibacteria bacterium]